MNENFVVSDFDGSDYWNFSCCFDARFELLFERRVISLIKVETFSYFSAYHSIKLLQAVKHAK